MTRSSSSTIWRSTPSGATNSTALGKRATSPSPWLTKRRICSISTGSEFRLEARQGHLCDDPLTANREDAPPDRNVRTGAGAPGQAHVEDIAVGRRSGLEDHSRA